MFKIFYKKYKVSFLDSKWQIIKNNVELFTIPKKNEYIYLNNKYYLVINIIHDLRRYHDVYVVLDEVNNELKITEVSF